MILIRSNIIIVKNKTIVQIIIWNFNKTSFDFFIILVIEVGKKDNISLAKISYIHYLI